MEFGLSRGLTRRRLEWASPRMGPLRAWIGWLGGVSLLALVTLVAWLLVRRVSGAFQKPLATPSLLLAAAVASLAALVLAETCGCPGDRRISAPRRLYARSLVVTLAVFAATISLPGSPSTGLAVLWGGIATAAVWILARAQRRAQSGVECGSLAPPTDTDPRSWPPARDVGDVPICEEEDAASLPADVDQQLTRGRDDTGQIYVQGAARVLLPAGHRSASLHIAICPPLETSPQVQVEQLAGPAATIRVGMVLPQGVRFDVRRLEAIDADEAVVLEFYAV